MAAECRDTRAGVSAGLVIASMLLVLGRVDPHDRRVQQAYDAAISDEAEVLRSRREPAEGELDGAGCTEHSCAHVPVTVMFPAAVEPSSQWNSV